jgi:hypothetical protein
MPKIDLIQKKSLIISTATDCFYRITGLPQEVRKDDKERTGIQVLVREPNTRNLVFISVGTPSEAAMFFAAEKAVRSNINGDNASENSANPDRMEFAGSVTCYSYEGTEVQASVSGLKAEEDVTVGIMVLSSILEMTPKEVCRGVSVNGGRLPEAFSIKNHYLYPIVNGQ